MKPSRLFPILIIIFISHFTSYAQVKAKARSFYFQTSLAGSKALLDSTVIESTNADTIFFYTLNTQTHWKTRYVQRGPLVRDSFGTLLFDYRLTVGQKFYFNDGSHTDSFTVDSITYPKLGKDSYKTWHLRLLDASPSFRFSWTQSFGSLQYGWYYGNYRVADIGDYRKAICVNDSVYYWDSAFNGFEPATPAPTCNFPMLKHLLSIEETDMANGFKIFPIPASDILTIEAMHPGTMTIFDLQGRLLASQAISNGTQQFNISQFSPGTYWITIHTEQLNTSRKLIISR